MDNRVDIEEEENDDGFELEEMKELDGLLVDGGVG